MSDGRWAILLTGERGSSAYIGAYESEEEAEEVNGKTFKGVGEVVPAPYYTAPKEGA